MLGRLINPNEEERAISFQAIWGSGGDVEFTTDAGVVITQDNSLKISAVYAAVRLLTDTVSTLPFDTFRRINGDRVPFRPKPMWVDNPEVGVNREDHLQQVMVSLLLNGNAFIRVFRDTNGDVIALTVLDPLRVEVERNPQTREIQYRITELEVIIPRSEMLHITELKKPGKLRGVSRIDEVKEALGLTSALQEFAARFFGQGSTTSGLIEYPGALNQEQAKSMVDAFEHAHRGLKRSHRPGVLFGGAKFTKTGVDPNEAQMLQSREFQIAEIARVFRIPPHMLGITTPGAMSYASVEQNSINFVTYTLNPYLSKLEAAYSSILPAEAFVKFNTNALLRGDTTTRFAAYNSALQSGWLSINDIHRLEDLRPVEGGDVYRVPLANVDLAAANLVETDKRIMMAVRLVQAGFDPSESLAALDLPNIEHTGLPSVQLQGAAQIAPEDPSSAYDVGARTTHNSVTGEMTIRIPAPTVEFPAPIVNVEPPNVYVDAPVINLPAPEVLVEAPQQKRTKKTVQRDENNRIVSVTEEVDE